MAICLWLKTLTITHVMQSFRLTYFVFVKFKLKIQILKTGVPDFFFWKFENFQYEKFQAKTYFFTMTKFKIYFECPGFFKLVNFLNLYPWHQTRTGYWVIFYGNVMSDGQMCLHLLFSGTVLISIVY